MGVAAVEVRPEGAFVAGPLLDAALWQIVTGSPLAGQPAVLSDHLLEIAGPGGARAVPVAGEQVAGLRLADPAPDVLARLRYYLADPLERKTPAGDALRLLLPLADRQTGAPWSDAVWQAEQAPLARAVAADLMAAYDTPRAQVVAARRGMLAVRAASRLRAAAEDAPTQLRRAAAPGDVAVARAWTPYENFFAVEEYDLRFRRFDGSLSPEVNRATFVSGDAAVVLPYDPARDLVLVIEQFRPAPFARGDRQPWQLEPVAGRIDAGESPEQAARREAREEAGLELKSLLPIANYYPSPGAKTEYLYTFLGLADLPPEAARLGGLDAEGEDIRGHLLPFADLMALIETGEVATAPLILSALWLAPRRAALRAGVAGA